MSDFLRDRDIVNYELPVLDGLNSSVLEETLKDPETRWYGLRKLAQFARLGITAAGKWDPLLHPRGPDGKFISKFGWVRALIDGKWMRGYVSGIDPDGRVRVQFKGSTGTRTYTNFEASRSLYALPKPKARLNLPELGKSSDSWTKTGGQGGSNPGGKFKLAAGTTGSGTWRQKELARVFGAELEGDSSEFSFPGPTLTVKRNADNDPELEALPQYGFILTRPGNDTDEFVVLAVTRDETGKPIVTNVATGEPALIGADYNWPLTEGDTIFEVTADGELPTELAESVIERRVGALAHVRSSTLDEGDEVYVKQSKSLNHARNEVLANRLYELAGVPIPDVHFGEDPQYVGSKILTGNITPLKDHMGDEAIMSEIRSNMVVDAWLANWDAVGLVYDNIVIVDGVPTRIDAGGSLLYRAQGGPKGKNFGGQVTELETLRNSSMNPSAAKVFGGVTDDELRAGANRVAAIHPDTIREYIDESGLDSSVANTLIARRADLIEKVLGGVDPYAPPAVVEPPKPDLSEYEDSVLLDLAETLLSSNEFHGSNIEKELLIRGLYDQLDELQTSNNALTSKGVNPKYKAVLPTAPQAATDDVSVDPVALVSEAPDDSSWLWDPKSKVWYRGPSPVLSAYEADFRLAAESFLFNGDAKNAEISSIDTVFNPNSGAVKPEMIGKWIWLGGLLWEISGDGDFDVETGTPTVRLVNVGNEASTIDLPRSDYYGKVDIFGSVYYKPKGAEVPLTMGYIVDPGENKAGLRMLAEDLHLAAINTTGSSDSHGFVQALRTNTDVESIWHPASSERVAVSTTFRGYNFAAPPPQIEGVESYAINPNELRIGRPSVRDLVPFHGDLSEVQPGTLVRVTDKNKREGWVFHVQADGRWKIVHKPTGYSATKNATHKNDDFQLGDVVEQTDINALYTVEVGTPAANEMYLALTERERILREADEKLNLALQVELATDKAATLSADDLLALDEDVPIPASVETYAKTLMLRDRRVTPTRKKFEPAKSPLTFVGVVPGDKLAAGMWIIGDPGATSRYGAAPMKILNVSNDADGSILGLQMQTLDGKTQSFDSQLLAEVLGLPWLGYGTKLDASEAKVLRVAPPAPSVSQPTLKKNGEVVVDGLVIGSYAIVGYENERQVTIHGQFTASGNEVIVTDRASKIKSRLANLVIVPKEHATAVAAKNAKAKKAATEIKWKVGKLADGTAVEAGTPVRSNVTGNEGVLVGSIHPQRDDLVYVKFDDGRLEVIDTVTLIALSKPKTSSTQKPSKTKAEPKPAIPIAKDLPPAVVEAMEKTPKNFVMADGGAPLVGMKVEAGKGAKVVTGHVLLVNKDGYMQVRDEDGKKHWRSIKVAKALESPSYADEPAIAATLATSAPDVPNIAPDENVVPQQPSLPLADVRILQDDSYIQNYVEGGGVLTFDGVVPDVGLPVIDRQGNRLIVAAKVASTKEAVVVFDPSEPHKLKSRKVSGLTTDIASYAGENGAISGVKLALNGHTLDMPANAPAGSSIYYATDVIQGQQRGIAHVIVVAPNGRTWKSTVANSYGSNASKKPSWTQTPGGSKEFFSGTFSGGKLRKLGVYKPGDDSGSTVLFQPGIPADYWNKSGATEPVITVLNEFSDMTDVFKTLADVKAADAPKVIGPDGEIITPNSIADLPGGGFGEPPGALQRNPQAVKPIPVVTGQVVDHTRRPELTGTSVKSPVEAAMEVLELKDSADPGSGMRYAMMDEDYIEDALVSFQVVQDHENQFVELRFKLQEEQSEHVSEQLLISGDVEYGGWTQANTVFPTDLVEGDYISVYKSGATDSLKPLEEGSHANARVTGSAEFIGKSDKSGFDVYRVPVVTHAGEATTVDIELRDSGTVAVMSWDPDMIREVGGQGSLYNPTATALDSGWTAIGTKVSTPFGQTSNIHGNLSETGIANISSDGPSGAITTGGGRTLVRTLPDGTRIRFNAVPGSASGGTGHGSARRSEIARDVRIRVPADSADMDASITSALEAVGVPVEKQQPPTKEALARLALNKLNKHFSTTFKHRERAQINDLSADSPEVAAILDRISKRVNLTGSDAMTLDDVEFAVSKDGRVTPMLSKRVAEAVTKRQGNVYYRHSLGYGSDVELITSIFGNPASTGLQSSDERWSFGVTTTGQSTTTDMRNGAGDRVYITGMVSSSITGKVIMSATAINRTLDGYVNGGDGWGKRKAENKFVEHGDAYEYMIKRKIEVEQIAYVIVDSSDRKKIIDNLKKRGVTMIGNRPIEDIIVSEKPKVDPGFQDLGTDAFEIGGTLGTVLGADAGPAASVGAPV